jgi:cytochrome c-type biogenesis protein
MTIGIGLVFLAGLVSFISPCVLSLIPVYVGMLGGTVETDVAQKDLRTRLFLRTLTFIAGFSVVFILLGMSGTIIGSWLYPFKDWIARIGGILIILFGLQVAGFINIPIFNREWMLRTNTAGSNSQAGAFFLGIAFSAGWSPCIGPILGSVLTALVATNANLWQGMFYLAVYSAGMAVPFLLMSLGLGSVIETLRQKHKLVHAFQVASGVVMVVMGVLLALGITSRLNALGWKVIL